MFATSTTLLSSTPAPPSISVARRAASLLLHPASDRDTPILVPPDVLVEIVEGISRSAPLHTLQPGTERRWRRLLTTAGYDAWLIAWPAGTGLDWHDHWDSVGAFKVVCGELVETYTDPDQLRALRTRRLVAGGRVSFDADYIHNLHNPGPVEAVSVHAYSPPLTEVRFTTAMAALGREASG